MPCARKERMKEGCLGHTLLVSLCAAPEPSPEMKKRKELVRKERRERKKGAAPPLRFNCQRGVCRLMGLTAVVVPGDSLSVETKGAAAVGTPRASSCEKEEKKKWKEEKGRCRSCTYLCLCNT